MVLRIESEILHLKEDWEDIKSHLPWMDREEIIKAREEMDRLSTLIQEKMLEVERLLRIIPH